MSSPNNTPKAYGIIAEFESPEAVIEAAKRVRDKGYRKVDAYTPFPVHGLDDAIGFQDLRIKWIIFFSGLFGCCVGLGMQYYVSVIEYPLNSGGRPLFSWPSFIPVSFECTILLAAFGAVFGMLFLNGLPRLNHPIFNASRIERASQDGFFLCIESGDPLYSQDSTKSFLESLEPSSVEVIMYDQEQLLAS